MTQQMAGPTRRSLGGLIWAFRALLFIISWRKDVQAKNFSVTPTLPVNGSAKWLFDGKVAEQPGLTVFALLHVTATNPAIASPQAQVEFARYRTLSISRICKSLLTQIASMDKLGLGYQEGVTCIQGMLVCYSLYNQRQRLLYCMHLGQD
jgi:hypothetical protein